MPGAFTAPLPAVGDAERALSDAAVQALLDYAERVESYSLIVYHAGAIQLERYWLGMGPDDITETYSAAKSITSIMFGFAVADGHIESIDEPTRELMDVVGDLRCKCGST